MYIHVHCTQVIHDAIDSAECRQQSSTTACQGTTPLPCTCEDHEHTKCFCGLDEYVQASDSCSQMSKSDANFDSSVIEIDL